MHMVDEQRKRRKQNLSGSFEPNLMQFFQVITLRETKVKISFCRLK